MLTTLRPLTACLLAPVLITCLTVLPYEAHAQVDEFVLTILHNNDGESQLINAGGGLEDFGGAARFKTLVDSLKARALRDDGSGLTRGVLMLSSGDNFLAGPEFNASLAGGVPFFDTQALDLIGYDAIALGNHDFDFGPDVLVDFISGFSAPVPYLSANLDFSAEPGLQALVDAGTIAASVILEENGEMIGIIGATTPNLNFISSPRNVVVSDDVAAAVQTEVDALEAAGVDKIILISHLQGIEEDLALATELSGVDVMIAGGGDELLANTGTLLIPGDEGNEFGPYPLTATDADGAEVPVVTTTGEYRYVGRLIVTFDENGVVTAIDNTTSGPVRVAGGAEPDAVAPNAEMQTQVVDPIQAFVDALASNVIGTSEVALDGRRSEVRSRETNEGNLVADALRWQASELAEAFGVPLPDVALQNGGGIRNNTLIAAGDISELTTFDILPFGNFVAVVPDIPADQFKEILENAVSAIGGGSGTGRFAQISGFRMTYDSTGTPQQEDDDGNVLVPGTRVQSAVLDDGRVIVQDGAVVQDAPTVTVATIDFLARGGDQYPFRGAAFTSVGVSYQQALSNYIQQGLNGLISAAQYPEGGEGRIILLTATANESGLEIPTTFAVQGNYPNPFNPTTTLVLDLPARADVRVTVFDLLGREVLRLPAQPMAAGRTQAIRLDAAALASGIYFYRVTAEGATGTSVATGRMILTR